VLLVVGCPTASETFEPTPEPTPVAEDRDADGSPDAEDCAPLNPEIYPGAPELCDRLDSDCDGVVPPEEVDSDGDGLAPCEGDCEDGDLALHSWDYDLDGQSTCAGDCDDFEPLVNSLDSDEDGVSLCDGDCDDANAARFPGNIEASGCDGVDNDCIADPDEDDLDGDGYRPCSGDCADLNPSAFPGGVEVCDFVDNDCNGVKDDLLPTAPSWPAGGDLSGLVGSTVLRPEAEDDRLGTTVAAGDVNGDGFGDLILAMTNAANPLRNAVYLIHGPFCGDASVGDPRVGVVDWRLQQAQAVSSIGDVNNDGYDDVRVYTGIHFGPLSGESQGEADWRLDSIGPTQTGDFDVLNVGDISGDGHDDIAVSEDGAPWTWDPTIDQWVLGPGRLLLFWGPLGPGVVDATDADAVLSVTATDPQQGFGQAFTSGDFNGDGISDLAVSAGPPAWTTYIVAGPIPAGVHMVDSDPLVATIEYWAQGLVGRDLNSDGASELGIAGLAAGGVPQLSVFEAPIDPGCHHTSGDAAWTASPTVSSGGGLIGAAAVNEEQCFLFRSTGLDGIQIPASSLHCGSPDALVQVAYLGGQVMVAVGDVNDDGSSDFIAGDSSEVSVIFGPPPNR